MGRTTYLADPNKRQRFLEALQSGNTIATACNYAGWTESAWYKWQNRAQKATEEAERDDTAVPDSEALYVSFVEEVHLAQAQAEVRAVALVQKAMLDTWQAAAWWLERSRPKAWGRTYRHEISGDEGRPVELAVEDKRQAVLDTIRAIADRQKAQVVDGAAAGAEEKPGAVG